MTNATLCGLRAMPLVERWLSSDPAWQNNPYLDTLVFVQRLRRRHDGFWPSTSTRSCHSRFSREETLRPVEQGSLLTLGSGGDRHDQRRNTTLALTPPKPKPLEMACSIAMGRALFDTRSTPSAAASG